MHIAQPRADVAGFAFWGLHTAPLTTRSGRLINEVPSEYES